MNRRNAVATLATIALTTVTVGCGFYFGDKGTGVAITNRGSATVTYFAEGVGERPDSAVAIGKSLNPGVTDHDTWLIAEGARAKVYAKDASGALVYCQVITKSDLRAQGWRVLIEPGQLSC